MSLTKTAKISEANVSKAIQDLLSAKKILWFRMNSSAQLLSYTNKAGQTKKRMLRGHKPGTADLLAILPGRIPSMTIAGGGNTGTWSVYGDQTFQTMSVKTGHVVPALWIEVKAPGKKQSPEQVEFQREVEEYGCSYLLADSIDTVIDWLKARGI